MKEFSKKNFLHRLLLLGVFFMSLMMFLIYRSLREIENELKKNNGHTVYNYKFPTGRIIDWGILLLIVIVGLLALERRIKKRKSTK